MTGCIAIHCTCATAQEAQALATALVERRLAACCQIEAITSVYRWQGTVEHAQEHRLTIKTTAARFEAAAAAIRELHSYDTPEIAALPIVAGTPDYLAWIADSVA